MIKSTNLSNKHLDPNNFNVSDGAIFKAMI